MFPTNSAIWKSIDGYSSYEVSWYGRVRNATTDKILKGGLSGPGYLTAGLHNNGEGKTHYVHKLVAHEWVLNLDSKRCADHIDGDKTSNHHDNLRWATHSENSRNMKHIPTVRASSTGFRLTRKGRS